MANTKRKAEGTEVTTPKRARIVTDANSKAKRVPFNPKSQQTSKTPKSHNVEVEDQDFEDGQRNTKTADGEQKIFLNGTSSREAHAKQKAERLQRKSAKPSADLILRSKKLWERLRRKSHVPREERQELVKELFEIITGRVHDFVFKHDSVRVIQCALKYANPDQKKQIVHELKGSYKDLAESKYAKFLIAKMVVDDKEVKNMVVEEFMGSVKRLIRHPEAGWIVDDIYRTLCTKEQRGRMVREWYGLEFVLFNKEKDEGTNGKTGELKEILEKHPEKRGPIMQHLKEMTNQLVQNKKTGFTMLHDAMLQYALNMKPDSPEATEFWEMLKDDEDGDCYRNLAFTKNGARLVCLALAYGSSKDRRTILKFFKTHINLLAEDANGHLVLLAAYEVIDDTVMSSKSIISELLYKDLSTQEREQNLLGHVQHLCARIPLLWLMNTVQPKWLANLDDLAIIEEIRVLRQQTSKKDPETRRIELVKAISQPLLDLIATHCETLMQSILGCQFVAEVLLGGIGEKDAALKSIADFVSTESEDTLAVVNSPAVGRMLKALAQGGRFDQTTKKITPSDPPLNFSNTLAERLAKQRSDMVISWACGPNSFVVVAMLEAPEFVYRDDLTEELILRRELLVEAGKSNAGSRILLETIGTEPKKTLKLTSRDKAAPKPGRAK